VPVEGTDDGPGPGPGVRDLEASPPLAAYESGRDVQDAVAQCLGCGFGQLAVEGQELEPGA
jgi:hypothetical protein